jgi:tetraacyldisaccharide 4'-kinase
MAGKGRGTGPASALYGAGARLAKLAWDRGWIATRAAPLPVVSVGALTAGGAGKTPFVRWLAGRLREAGRAPAILTRGYGGRGGQAPRVVDRSAPDPARDGDEPVLLARSLPDVPVVVCPDRLAGARLAAVRGADLLILDDGFQHRRLRRDLDLVLWDRAAERSDGRLLPAGFLREPLSALDRAGVVLLVDRGDGFPASPPRGPGADRQARIRLVPGARQPVAAGTRVHALSGLADPASFERSLESLGLFVTGATRYPDHHPFTVVEVREVARRAEKQSADVIAVTAKDWTRWPRSERSALPVPAVFDLDVELVAGDPVGWSLEAASAP